MSDKKLAVIMDPLQNIKPHKDSSLAMMLEAQERGFELFCGDLEDIWLQKNEDNMHKYVAVCIDDLAMALKDPEAFVKQLQSPPCSFKLKGSGPITFHLGMDFFRDSDEVLCMAPRKCIEKMIANCEHLFGEPPKQNMQPS